MFSLSSRRKRGAMNIDTSSKKTVSKVSKENNKEPSPIQKQSTKELIHNKKTESGIKVEFRENKKEVIEKSDNNSIKKENIDFRKYVQKIENDGLKYDKQKRIDEDNKYKLWVKTQE